MRYQERASVLVDMPENAKGRLIMVWTKLLRVAINHSPSKHLVQWPPMLSHQPVTLLSLRVMPRSHACGSSDA